MMIFFNFIFRMTGSDTPNNEMESTLPNGRSSPQVLQVMRPYYEQEQLNNELLYSKPKSNGEKFVGF